MGRPESKESPMKYMLMMNAPKGSYEALTRWAPQDLKAHIEFMKGFVQKLQKSGELVVAEGLSDPTQAKRVRAAEDGSPVTDGVFAETKEFLAGFWIVEVDSDERAHRLAAEASAAPGPGGKPLNMAIEVRSVPSGPPPTDF
jgi:hypothetical protein